MVQRLPSSVAKLKGLRHLIVLTRGATDLLRLYPATATRVPEGLENLTSLQTLKYVQANQKIVRSLAHLGQMRCLELSGIDASLTADLSSSISRMSFLLRLGLEINAVLDLESISRPPLKLQKLTLAGRLARGKLPSWICSLTSLLQLRLSGCQIAQDSLVLLAALPRLVNLSLVKAYHERSIIFTRDGSPALRKLTLEGLPNLSHIEFQEGCLVNLRDLVLGQCAELSKTPQGMGNLEHIQNLELFGMPTEFVDKLKEQDGDAAYHNPASSDFYQAPRVLRFVKFVKRNR
jgi:disease resistance protein RPM1